MRDEVTGKAAVPAAERGKRDEGRGNWESRHLGGGKREEVTGKAPLLGHPLCGQPSVGGYAIPAAGNEEWES